MARRPRPFLCTILSGRHGCRRGGSANYVKDVGPVSQSHDQVSDSDTVFVVEPAIKAELNVTPWMRVTTGVSYRMVRGVNQVMLRNKDLSGIAGSLGFKFGKF
jgi:hypothetical protein